MYSKPKGMYIKHREKSSRRLSPRTSDDTDPHSSSEVQFSQRSDDEAFEVEIQQDGDSDWPRQNFEHEMTSIEPKPGTSKEIVHISERAHQYMVKNDSYKDLTGTRLITVPEPNKNGKKKETSPRPKPPVGSVRSYKQVESVKHVKEESATLNLRPVARVKGTYRGYPHKSVSKYSHSHLATIRLPSKRQMRHGKMATLRLPQNSTMKSVKGYHVGQNATVRLHNTGHAIRHLRHTMPSWDKPDAAAFKRHTFLSERKEYYISQFAIELDRPDHDFFNPGEFLSGRVILEASSSIEIRFVELIIIGLATVHFSKNDPNLAKNGQEVLLNKRSYMMGTPDGRWNSVITAGKYVSKFRFRLPNNLPSTVKYESKEHGFSFEINYLVKARICDEIGSSSTRSIHSTNNLVKVLLTRRFPFMVRGRFDIHSIPQALQPVTHSEYVNLSCLPIFLNTASLVLSLDRSVFLAGDDIRVKLTTNSKTAKKVKMLTCELHQRVQTNIKMRQNFTIIHVQEHEPEGMPFQQNNKTCVLFEFTIPTKTQFISSYLQGCSLARVSYAIAMTVRFKGCSGLLFLECPVSIGPSADPMSPRDTTSLPVFNRPRRFPHFSRDSTNHTPKPQNGTAHTAETEHRQVKSTFKPDSARSLFCCCF